MKFSVQVRLAGDLLDVAKVMRVLKRYRMTDTQVQIEPNGGDEVMAVQGTIFVKRYPQSLELALSHLPRVLDAVVLGLDDRFDVL